MTHLSSDEKAVSRITAVASRVFFHRGFARVSMDDLARELGMSKKTIYRHFPAKEHLVREVHRKKIAEIAAFVRTTVAAEVDFTDKLYRIWSGVGKELAEMEQPYLLDLQVFLPGLARELETFRRDEINRSFLLLIDDGIRLGALRPDINRDVLVRMYISAIVGVITPAVLVDAPFSIDEAFHTILDVMFDGILADGARDNYRSRFASGGGR